ncbi:MAG: hypothetical protein FWF96_03600 [Kiritimatiellaeota bacterium]|nr:hypothetical protein [Kiritimatiellota bacterium]
MKCLCRSLFLAGVSLAVCRADQVTLQQGQRSFQRTGSDVEIQRDAQRRAYPGSVATSPVMFSLLAPVQLPSMDWDVKGFRLGIFYSECVSFDGLDINGLVGRATGHGNGLQLAGICNYVDGSGVGLQIAPVNIVEGGFAGIQLGLANYAGTLPGAEGKGFQAGFFNGASVFKGFQLGVINYTEMMVGVQIGLINIIQDKDWSFLPIVNAAF